MFELGTYFSTGAIVYLMALLFLGLDKFERKDLNHAITKFVRYFKDLKK